MVKGDGYGHGAVPIARHLKAIGIERLGVATVEEGIQLRQAGLKGPIHLFGNTQGWELESCLKYNLLATAATEDTIIAMGKLIRRDTCLNIDVLRYDGNYTPGTVHIKIDTGMSRNGCQPENLCNMTKLCEDEHVPLEGICTHLADYSNKEFTQFQLEAYYKAIEPYRDDGLLFHVANSGGILTSAGTELDMIRPGIALYGLPPGDEIEEFKTLGFKPVASMYGQTSLVKKLEKGRMVGYGCTYTCDKDMWVATVPVGYADGYWRHLSAKGCVIRQSTGERCPLIGRVSMDAITVQVLSDPPPVVGESFILLTADYDSQTSATGIANILGTINYEVTTRFQGRMPRLYTTSYDKSKSCVESLTRPHSENA